MSVNDERLRLLRERLDELDCLALTGESVNAAPRPVARPALNPQAPATPAALELNQKPEARAALLDDFQRNLARIAAEAESAFSAAVESRLKQLKTITDGMAQRFLGEIDAAMRQSAGVMTSQALRLAEEEVLLVARRGIEECAAAPASGRGLPAGENQRTDAAATTDPARIAEAAMTKLEARLAASLQAFEEQAARRLAERLGAIIQDLLAREKASSAASVASQQRPALIHPEPQPPSTRPGAPPANPLPAPANTPSSPTVAPTKAPIQKDVPKSTKKTKWTVLGLR